MSDIQRLERGSGALSYRLQLPQVVGDRPVILLHGLTGDENAMWLLTRAFPSEGLIAAPRGLFPLGGDGYSWVDPSVEGEGEFSDFQPAVESVRDLLTHLSERFSHSMHDFVLMGFSQGAALGLAVARDGRRPAGVATLAGFLPGGELRNLGGLPIYWGHGTQDQRVPVWRARQDVEMLVQAGAKVTYCEADVGHKVGLECMHDLGAWFLDLSDPIDTRP